MSNEQELPVYRVPGEGGNPDLYYLRGYTSDESGAADTLITKDQFDGINEFIRQVTSDLGAPNESFPQDIPALHAAQDPANPAFTGDPAAVPVATAADTTAAGSGTDAAQPVLAGDPTPGGETAPEVTPSDPAVSPDPNAVPESENTDTEVSPSLPEPPVGEVDPNAPVSEVPTSESDSNVDGGEAVPTPLPSQTDGQTIQEAQNSDAPAVDEEGKIMAEIKAEEAEVNEFFQEEEAKVQSMFHNQGSPNPAAESVDPAVTPGPDSSPINE